jgi:hypothetical protein
MKKTLAIATLLSLMAVPSFAQSFDPDVGSGNIVPNQGGANAYAQAPGGPYTNDFGGGYHGGGGYYYGSPRYYYRRPYKHWSEF